MFFVLNINVKIALNNHLKCSTCQEKHNSLSHKEIKGNNTYVSNPSSLSKLLKSNGERSNIYSKLILDH